MKFSIAGSENVEVELYNVKRINLLFITNYGEFMFFKNSEYININLTLARIRRGDRVVKVLDC